VEESGSCSRTHRVFIAPWWAVEKGPDLANYIATFTANYRLILGPIAGIMIADYYVVKRGDTI
jgi:cytosine/uracil/thiamine/allantoin permease